MRQRILTRRKSDVTICWCYTYQTHLRCQASQRRTQGARGKTGSGETVASIYLTSWTKSSLWQHCCQFSDFHLFMNQVLFCDRSYHNIALKQHNNKALNIQLLCQSECHHRNLLQAWRFHFNTVEIQHVHA